MANTTRMRWLLLGTGAVVLATTTASAQGSGIPVAKDRPPSSTTATTTITTSPGEVVPTVSVAEIMAGDLALARSANDAQIIDAMITGDSLEVAFGRLALDRGTNAGVRSLAQVIVNDHSASLAEEREMAVDEDIGRQAIPGMQLPGHLMRVYDSMATMSAGNGWDRAWLQHQIAHHRHTLDLLNAFRPNARDDDLEQQIDRVRPVVQRHLDQALSVAQSLGMDTSTMAPEPR